MSRVGRLLLLGVGLTLAGAAIAQDNDLPLITYPAVPHIAASAEEFVSPGWVAVSRAEGDLNRDGRRDVALALWPEQAAKSYSYEQRGRVPPYRLVIAFARPTGGYGLVVDNKTLIVPPDDSGGYEDPLGEGDLSIVGGSLDISRQLLRGHFRYRFRWSGGQFRLIGYDYGGSDGACITLTSINYLTRRAKIEVMPISEERRNKVVLPVKRAPLPTFETVNSLEFWADGMGVDGDWPDCPKSDG